jgi:hypothetical protein
VANAAVGVAAEGLPLPHAATTMDTTSVVAAAERNGPDREITDRFSFIYRLCVELSEEAVFQEAWPPS